jgi:hypothetical protein
LGIYLVTAGNGAGRRAAKTLEREAADSAE